MGMQRRCSIAACVIFAVLTSSILPLLGDDEVHLLLSECVLEFLLEVGDSLLLSILLKWWVPLLLLLTLIILGLPCLGSRTEFPSSHTGETCVSPFEI